MKITKTIILIFLPLFINSCIIFSPEKIKLIDNSDRNVLKGLQITINEIPRLLGSNSTNIELYNYSRNELSRNPLITKYKYNWNTINSIKLENGEYKLVTYYHYIGKDYLRTETIIRVNNNRTDIEIEYPLFVTGRAKLKVNGIKTKKK